jgi:hypothetical protein
MRRISASPHVFGWANKLELSYLQRNSPMSTPQPSRRRMTEAKSIAFLIGQKTDKRFQRGNSEQNPGCRHVDRPFPLG